MSQVDKRHEDPLTLLGAKLAEVTRNPDVYKLLCQVFSPFEGNIRTSEMERYACAIESVTNDIEEFRRTGKLSRQQGITETLRMNISGLNDANTYGLFHTMNRMGSAADTLWEAVGFSQEDRGVIRKMLVEIERNKLTAMLTEITKDEISAGLAPDGSEG